MSDTYELWYHRTSQASSLTEAIIDGAVRKHTFDGETLELKAVEMIGGVK